MKFFTQSIRNEFSFFKLTLSICCFLVSYMFVNSQTICSSELHSIGIKDFEIVKESVPEQIYELPQALHIRKINIKILTISPAVKLVFGRGYGNLDRRMVMFKEDIDNPRSIALSNLDHSVFVDWSMLQQYSVTNEFNYQLSDLGA